MTSSPAISPVGTKTHGLEKTDRAFRAGQALKAQDPMAGERPQHELQHPAPVPPALVVRVHEKAPDDEIPGSRLHPDEPNGIIAGVGCPDPGLKNR